MKKIIAILLSLTMLSSFTTSFAEEYWVESDNVGTGQSEVYDHVYSSYCVVIPATIDLRTGETGNIKLESANIENGYNVRIRCSNIEDGAIKLYHTEDNETYIMCEILNAAWENIPDTETPIATFTQDEYDSGNNSKDFIIQSMGGTGKPGDYSGTVQYSFDCVPV